MVIRVVDERDITQEVTDPVFRVWKILDPIGRGVAVMEFTGMSMDEVEAWAEANSEFGYSLALVRPASTA
jgi:hypothetical protein